MLIAVLSGFVLAALTPWLARSAGDRTGWLLAMLPAALTIYFATYIPAVAAGAAITIHYPWAPGLGVDMSFLVDGLSLLFALMISLIGTFIVIYAGAYLAGHRDLPRFYVVILAFMASMLGLVLSDNLIAMFVFWELTSITSYLLIGFDHEEEKSRKSALQGLLVTAGGGLALLAGLILLGEMAGSYAFSEILGSGAIRGHDAYGLLLMLVLLGTFTKSAQVPFHFWLPNAMAAPTPVSAYLHSATMVKAGVYLMARLHPEMGGTELWIQVLSIVGAVTMVTGTVLALRSSEIKRMLAYSTVMALGTLTMLLGVGTAPAIVAAMAFMLGHSLYKGALFLIAGALDHETGTKDLTEMGGLARAMPITTVFASLAALSLAGAPPLFGFVAKELLFEAALGAPFQERVLLAATVIASMLTAAIAAILALRPFHGPLRTTPKQPHEAPWPMLLGPIVLATLGLVFGLVPVLAESQLVRAGVEVVYGGPVDFHLALWHGFNLPLALSALSLTAGLLIYWQWDRVRLLLARTRFIDRFGAEHGYERGIAGLNAVAAWQTRVLQNGYLRTYLHTILLATVVLLGWTLFAKVGMLPRISLPDGLVHEIVIASVIVAAAVFVSSTRSRLGAVASLGIVGFGVALLYVLFSAPDLGITQVLIETLTVILLVLVLFRLPNFLGLSSPMARLRDLLVAMLFGVTMTVLVLFAIDIQYFEPISHYFVSEAVPLGHGRNIVNVILVDFRALDTLGEIFVLALAAIGVYSMVKLRAETRR
jgi:multicomponent Na+:H+ antiporter subunit A